MPLQKRTLFQIFLITIIAHLASGCHRPSLQEQADSYVTTFEPHNPTNASLQLEPVDHLESIKGDEYVMYSVQTKNLPPNRAFKLISRINSCTQMRELTTDKRGRLCYVSMNWYAPEGDWYVDIPVDTHSPVEIYLISLDKKIELSSTIDPSTLALIDRKNKTLPNSRKTPSLNMKFIKVVESYTTKRELMDLYAFEDVNLPPKTYFSLSIKGEDLLFAKLKTETDSQGRLCINCDDLLMPIVHYREAIPPIAAPYLNAQLISNDMKIRVEVNVTN